MHYDNLNKQEIKDLLICFLFIVNNLEWWWVIFSTIQQFTKQVVSKLFHNISISLINGYSCYFEIMFEFCVCDNCSTKYVV